MILEILLFSTLFLLIIDTILAIETPDDVKAYYADEADSFLGGIKVYILWKTML